MTRQIILDTETTGLNPNDANHPDRLIEFAGLEMVNRQFTDNNLHLYINPERDIPDEAFKIHGISLEQLTDKPVFAEVAQQIFDFIQGAELIIHNAKFDIGFLNAEFARVGLPKVESVCKITDSLEMAKERYPGQKNSLDALCSRLDIDRSRRILHGALIDCELLGGVYLAMTRNQFSLIEEVTQKDTPQPVAAIETSSTCSQPLKILRATDKELSAHEAYLDNLDKSLGQPCLYRSPNE